MTVSAQKMADWAYALFTEQKEQFRDLLREALLAAMREGDGDKLLKALNSYIERLGLSEEEKAMQFVIRNQASTQYWDLCYDLAQRISLDEQEMTMPSKVVTLKNRQSIAGERNLVAIPIAFPIRAILDEGINLHLDALNERLRKEHGVSGHWFPGLVDDYPVAELHVVEWLKVHDELFYDRLPESRIEELRFDARRRADRFHYRTDDEKWDWDFLVVMGSIEGRWTSEAIQTVRQHLQEVIAPTRQTTVFLQGAAQNNEASQDMDYWLNKNPFVVGEMDFMRQAQYQGGWIAKQREVDDFITQSKGPFRLTRMETGLMRGWILGNGIKNWLYVTPDMHKRTWEECLMMVWEALERNGVGMVQIGDEKPKPGTIPAFVRY
ncbi:hypothetical protein RIE95_05505 [Acidithiobacillus thiooxidans]|uniref:hypothetical protein n=1 Tax=Acidithiobacillus thiooxidans TaxID=930 RepID=UPI002864D8E5|nr:hypothetical protein [Acidithiobacillus thiooxidans]MDR7926451.1 hypothetical protein [Acidithiobacillus thiooxidans]